MYFEPYEFAAEFIQQDFVMLPPGSITPGYIRQVAESWLKFSELPEEITSQFSFDPDEDGTPNLGWMRKQRSRGDKDNKDFFHYYPGLLSRLEGKILPPSLIYMLKACQIIYEQSMDIMGQLTGGLVRHGIVSEPMVSLSDKTSEVSVLRLLKYYATNNAVIAQPHIDKSAITIQIAESRDGMRGARVPRWPDFIHGDYQKRQWIEMHLRPVEKEFPHQPLVFVSQKLAVMTNLLPFWHKVVDIEAKTEGYVRWAIVFFYHTATQLTAEDKKIRNLFQYN